MVQDAKAAFREASATHGAGMLEGNASKTNRAFKKKIEALKRLRLAPDQGREALHDLLADADRSVRISAATYLLPLDADTAIAVLEREANGDRSMLRLSAEMVLREWRAGRLKLPA